MKRLSLMTKIRRKLHQTLKGREGQSTTEYILILAIVVMIASKMKSGLQNSVERGVGNLGDVIDRHTAPENFD